MHVQDIWTNLPNMSERISKASSWMDTSSCIPNAPINWDVIFLQTLTVRLKPSTQYNSYDQRSQKDGHLSNIISIPVDEGGSSAMTVFRPMLEMSLSCSLLETMLEQRVSTIVSTWHSFTLPTRGPRLHKPEIHYKKCWAKYKPALGKIWTNQAIGLFSTNNFDNWVKTTQLLGLSIFYPALGCI